MIHFSISIAGQIAAVSAMFESTRYYCRNYLTDAEPVFSVTVTPEALENEQCLLHREALEEGLRPRIFPEPFLERSFIQRSIADRLLERNILLFHGSTVAVDGTAYLFTAPCGTGKSTHTRLWREVFGQRAVMINDDKPFLELGKTSVLAWGAPWSGKHGLDTNTSAPLGGICILQRGSENTICKAAPSQRQFILSQRHHPENPEADRQSIALTEQLLRRIPIWHMLCNKDPKAAQTAWEAMHETIQKSP